MNLKLLVRLAFNCLGAFLSTWLTFQLAYLMAMVTRDHSGAGIQALVGLIPMTVYSVFFAIGYAPFWIPAGILAAWLVPRIATGQSVPKARWRGLMAGACIGAGGCLALAGRTTYNFYAAAQYRTTGDLAGRFGETLFSGLSAIAIVVFALWLGLAAQRWAGRRP
jgi:hypothetical protein